MADLVPAPLAPAAPAARPTPAEAARTLLAQTRTATLATLSEDGTPWASLIMFGLLDDGTPALLVSTLAEHGRNLQRDPRASLMVAAPPSGADPLANGRVTLAGRAVRPEGERERDARVACLEATSAAPRLRRVRRLLAVGARRRARPLDRRLRHDGLRQRRGLRRRRA